MNLQIHLVVLLQGPHPCAAAAMGMGFFDQNEDEEDEELDRDIPMRAPKVMRPSAGVIDPREAKWLAGWDLLTLFALAFTATIMPYEIAFLPDEDVLANGPSPLWVCNRLVDFFFLIDVLLTCNTMCKCCKHTKPRAPWPA